MLFLKIEYSIFIGYLCISIICIFKLLILYGSFIYFLIIFFDFIFYVYIGVFFFCGIEMGKMCNLFYLC